MRRRLASLIVTLSLLVLAAPLQAQVTLDATSSTAAAFATSQTTSHVMSAASGGCLVAAFLGDDVNDNVTGATFNGVSMTLAGKQNSTPSSVYWLYLFTLSAPASGTHNIVVSASGSIHLATLAVSYTGVLAARCSQVQAANTGSTDPYVSTITPTTPGSRVVMAYAGSSAPIVDSTNFTRRVSDGMDSFILGDSGNVAAGLTSLSVTGGGLKESELVALGPPSRPSSLTLGVFE